MPKKMFCYQCEQTAMGSGCTGSSGMCGKSAETAACQDKLIGAAISLSHYIMKDESFRTHVTDKLIIEALFATITNVNFDSQSIMNIRDEIENEIEKIDTEKRGKTDFDINNLWSSEPDTGSLKALVLFGLKGMAAYAYHALMLGCKNDRLNMFFYKALSTVGSDSGTEILLDTVLETGMMNYSCMAMLDLANTRTFGVPTPTEVSLTVDPGPFIVVSGHDLADLKRLLDETEKTGINVYTHGEMLPANAYPVLKNYSHLKGNFGTAWQNQQKEFDNLPAPVIFTTNCIMPPRKSYIDRVFTIGPVNYPGTKHISDEEGFNEVIKKALELGGYKDRVRMTGVNGRDVVTTGWSYRSILSKMPEILRAVKTGKIKHIFLVGGCDGARPGRNYYTDFVSKAPEDSIILTLGCGKYRFNDLDLGSVAGIPRLLDLGQCNDAYGAIQIITALSEELKCDVNDLPVSIVLSWYEQKAVAVLLSLIALGLKNIMLGPTFPACFSENVLKILREKYSVSLITAPDEDLAKLLSETNQKEGIV